MAYRRLPGSARRFENTETGETLSRRQYENIRAREYGFDSWSQYQNLGRDQTYKRWLDMHAERHGISIAEARKMDSDFNEKYTAAQNSDWSTNADGDFADLLVDIGEREDDWEWDVGDTPGETG
jgi:hypothetical protein